MSLDPRREDVHLPLSASPSGGSLIDRTLRGDVFVLRRALQAYDLYDALHRAGLRGVEQCLGKDAARRVETDGWHRIHEWVPADRIPALTDAVYAEAAPIAPSFLQRFVGSAFPDAPGLYYERTPNIRFHIPFDDAAAHQKAYREFAKQYGEGKIAAHGPHRDSWLDCPSNGVNLWFAIGRVRSGNGLTIYPRDYHGAFIHQRSGDIADGERLHKPWTFDLEPGDGIMFHTDQLHGSELNRTSETRFAISFRLSFVKPRFPQTHFHRYVHAGWNASPLKPLAELPAMLQPSYAKSFVVRVKNRLFPRLRPAEPEPKAAEAVGSVKGDRIELPLAEVPAGAIRGLPKGLCVARLSESEVVAFVRRCPHAGGDLANGWIDDGKLVCPWHNLPFDPGSGRSPCESLRPLKRAECRIEGGNIVVQTR